MCSVAFHESASSKMARIGLEMSSEWTSLGLGGEIE